MAEKPSLTIVDDPAVRESVATNAVGGLLSDNTLFVTLAAQRVLAPTTGAAPGQTPSAHVTARLALTPTAAVELVNLLSGLLSAVPGVSFAQAPQNQVPQNPPQ